MTEAAGGANAGVRAGANGRRAGRTRGAAGDQAAAGRRARTGVLLVNTGTPEEPTPAAVRAYLGRFLMDPRIAPMNRVLWWCILHLFILPKRAVASAEKYQAIWTPEGSPLIVAHERLSQGLAAYYRERGLDVEVHFAMSYSAPTLPHAVRDLRASGCDSLVVLPLYPQSAYSTTGAVSDGVARAVRKARFKGEVTVIDNYHDDPVYLRAIAASVKRAGFEVDSDDRLLFSFHSIPLSDIERGDTYELQTGATSLGVANELGLERRRWTVAYQCRFDKGREWLAPFASQKLASWAESGARSRVFMVCPNFAVDCLETLYDVERELKPGYLAALRAAGAGAEGKGGAGAKRETSVPRVAKGAGAQGEPGAVRMAKGAGAHAARAVREAPEVREAFTYVPCLNKSKAHLRVLAHVLAPYVGDALDEDRAGAAESARKDER
ncbi:MULTISPECIES: ferrochelatase [unclassified Adlercreutzia]|uniref:ferrochelatase n=1 Tax=unclassified Adlercreutzia TaxID=2636013 RepID=UPI0013E9F8E8|nr:MULTISPECIES: ferrochelatase [unclassified Adlercreutzia]